MAIRVSSGIIAALAVALLFVGTPLRCCGQSVNGVASSVLSRRMAPGAMVEKAQALLSGRETTGNPDQDRKLIPKLFQMAGRRGETKADLLLGQWFLVHEREGRQRSQQAVTAQLLERAARAGWVEAQYQMGLLTTTDGYGPTSARQAFFWLLAAATSHRAERSLLQPPELAALRRQAAYEASCRQILVAEGEVTAVQEEVRAFLAELGEKAQNAKPAEASAPMVTSGGNQSRPAPVADGAAAAAESAKKAGQPAAGSEKRVGGKVDGPGRTLTLLVLGVFVGLLMHALHRRMLS